MGASVFTEHVVPTFGNILATAMLVSPLPAVLRIRKSGKLGAVNPLPYPMTCVNAAGWVAYGYAVSNPYIFPANIIGFLAGLFFTFTAYSCASRKAQDLIMSVFVLASAHYILLGLIACFALPDRPGAVASLWGRSAVVILMAYYFVPLSTMVGIVRTRNAASIYPPLAACAIANGSMWTVYGLAVQDPNLWVPNGFGAIIGVVQLALRLMYGAKPTGTPDEEVAMVAPGSGDSARPESGHSPLGAGSPDSPDAHVSVSGTLGEAARKPGGTLGY